METIRSPCTRVWSARTRRVVQIFEDPIQGPAPLYTKVVAYRHGGTYRLEIIVKDTTNGKLAADNIEFEVK